jgi:hypothetical protein
MKFSVNPAIAERGSKASRQERPSCLVPKSHNHRSSKASAKDRLFLAIDRIANTQELRSMVEISGYETIGRPYLLICTDEDSLAKLVKVLPNFVRYWLKASLIIVIPTKSETT